MTRFRLGFSFLMVLSLAPGVSAAEGTVAGRVTSSGGDPALDVRVVLLELNRSQYVDDDGRYAFESVPYGEYHVQAISPRFGSVVAELSHAGPTTTRDLVLGQSRHRERVVVTATRSGRGSAEVIQPVNVLDKNDLVSNLQPSLGDSLAQEPGIRSSSYGAGAGRPIVRGQSAGRVRVLEGGLDAGDASTTSVDHAVAIDPLGAEQVEILRGPSTLLYGGEAVGGVVNVIDDRIPEHRASRPVAGTVRFGLGSVSDERGGSGSVGGGHGAFAWHAEAHRRDADDYEIPSGGRLANSSVESDGGAIGVSWVGERSFVGVATKSFDTEYGIPGGEPIRIDLRQERYDLRGGVEFREGPVTGARFDLGVTDYAHREIEDGQTGTIFNTDGAEARVEMTWGRGPRWNGVTGLHLRDRDVEALGAEAFLPPNETEQLALFAVQEYDPAGPLRWEFGLRGERAEVRNAGPSPDREFDTLSGSTGMAWIGDNGIAVGVSVSSSSRAPSAEELYSFGEHVATMSFEVGDPALGEETALGVDVNVRKRYGPVSGEFSLFRYDYDDYIYEFDTGMTEPPMDPQGLPVFRFAQQDAEFGGFELNGLIELKHTPTLDFDLELVGDYVRAEFADGDAVPRIPPLSLGAGLLFNGPNWHGGARLRWHDEQARNAPSETTTGAYTTLNASIGYRLARNRLVHDFVLRLNNLTDEEIRPHTSRLKDTVPLPGRNIGLVYSLVF